MSEKLKNQSDFKSTIIYKTERGDDLFGIAEKFSTTAQILVSENALKGEPLCGELLYIEIPRGKRYIVKPGDTLESVSRKFGKSELETADKNKIDDVYVGQTIYI